MMFEVGTAWHANEDWNSAGFKGFSDPLTHITQFIQTSFQVLFDPMLEKLVSLIESKRLTTTLQKISL